MEELLLARWQFGITTVYHFFFVPLTMGLSIFVAITETMYVVTNNPIYKQMAKFWGKLFVINFAMGVVTGIVQEFQFGMNWAEFSRYVGDIFGAPLAMEALLAFFLESTFIAIWLFGWDKLSKPMHAAAMWIVAFGTNLSAFWILSANAFMQNPVGYEIVEGRAQMVDFLALLTNPYLWHQFPHVFFGGVTTAGFFVLGITIFHLGRKSPLLDGYKKSLNIGAIFAFIGIFLTMMYGHSLAQSTHKHQPMKMAAMEALWETEDPASLSLFTIGDEDDLEEYWSIDVPNLLSILVYNSPEGEVKGLKELQAEYEEKYGPGDYVPPIALSYWSFRIMVGAGMVMFLLACYGVYKVLRQRFHFHRYVVWAFLGGMILPYVANSAGWVLTEIGRQPWVVYGLLKTADGVSLYVDQVSILISLIGFTLVYLILMIADIYLLRKFALKGIQPPEDDPVVNEEKNAMAGESLLASKETKEAI